MSDDDTPPRHERHGSHSDGLHQGASDFFNLAGSDPELLNTGRIPDPLPDHASSFRWMAKVLIATEARLRARGTQSIRGLIRVFWAFIALAGIFLLVGPVINAPLDIDDILASADISDVDWFARDVALDYTIGKDDDGAFTTDVSESFTMFFRDDRSASEVQRAVVTEFRGHGVDFDLHSATIDGAQAEVRITRNPSMTMIHISPADGSELSGQHEIALTYDLQNLVISSVDEATDRAIDLWSWPLFASWPQATSGIEASFTLSPEVNDAMVRAPNAYVGWLLVSATQRLTPEAGTAGGVRYSFSNDDNLPPNADFWIQASFKPGTFTLPPTTPLFWLQTWGPLIPLVLLGVLLLFGLAARRVVWADSAGRPWFISRSEPPRDLEPQAAAQLMRKPWHAELISALSAAPSRIRQLTASRAQRKGVATSAVSTAEAREAWIADVARIGHRTGRLGNLPAAIAQRTKWSIRKPDPIVEQKLRWIPDSYLRDTFLLAPLAIALIQWGLLRQLSHQVILTVLWLPFAIVVASTVLALATMWAVRKPRPLTTLGARVMQELKGIDVFARATRLTERGSLDDPLMPYAMLFQSPRHAGSLVVEQAVSETRDRNIDRGWRTSHFISVPAFLGAIVALAIFVGAIVAASAIAPPYSIRHEYATSFGSVLPGISRTQTTGFEIEASLSRNDDGTARLNVVEHHTVDFDDSGSRVPQFAREWPASRLGQDLGVTDVNVRIDGAPVDFRTADNPDARSLYVVTQLEAALSGSHEVDVSYVASSPVVAATGDGNQAVEQLRWTALYNFWEDDRWTDLADLSAGRTPVRPIRIEFTIAADLLNSVQDGGWIDSDFDRPEIPYEYGNWLKPWQYTSTTYIGERGDAKRYELRIGKQETRPDGSLLATIDVDAVQSRQRESSSEETAAKPWAIDKQLNAQLGSSELDMGSEVGVRIDFAEGTFSGIHAASYRGYQTLTMLPYALLLALAGLVIVASTALIFVTTRLRKQRRRGSASIALIGYFAIPLAAIAQCIVFFWTIGPAAGDDSRIPAAMWLGAVMFVAVITEMVTTARSRQPSRPHSKTQNKR